MRAGGAALSLLTRSVALSSVSHRGIRTRSGVPLMSTATDVPEISDLEKFLFDLNGFLVLRGVLSPEEVAAANAAVDAKQGLLHSRDKPALRNTKAGSPLDAAGPRYDMGGMLAWEKPHCDTFRKMLAHPKLVPYITELCGVGYRLDHQPMVIAQERDSEGFSLHGGPISSDGRFNPELQYRSSGGQQWTSLLAVSFSLCDHNPGDGGFCIVRGSHKLTMPVPKEFATGEAAAFGEHVHQPTTKAGDVVLWSEATVHGATAWRGAHQRRIALYRFAPGNMGYGRGYLEVDPVALEGMTAQQRAVLEPPYANRLDRPLVTPQTVLEPDGPTALLTRNAEKRDFDAELFGTKYF